MKKVRTFKEYLYDEERISKEEREAILLEADLICKMIEAREEKGLTQKQLADKIGLKQPAIARLEKQKVVPKIDTMLKILVSLGYTLKIVPLEAER